MGCSDKLREIPEAKAGLQGLMEGTELSFPVLLLLGNLMLE